MRIDIIILVNNVKRPKSIMLLGRLVLERTAFECYMLIATESLHKETQKR